MLKRLFLVIFILQTFATSAWAGMDMSQLNQAELTQMKIMHHEMALSWADDVLEVASPAVVNHLSAMSFMDMSAMDMTAELDCPMCAGGTECSNVMCNALHSVPPVMTQAVLMNTVALLAHGTVSTLLISVQYSNNQPETPPPSA